MQGFRWRTLMLVLVLSNLAFAAEVKNLKVGQAGDKAVATYDLVPDKGEKKAVVTVSITINGEVRKAEQLHITGALGKAVAVGKGKKVIWDVTKDLPADFDWDKAEFNWNVMVPSKIKEIAAGEPEVPKPPMNAIQLGSIGHSDLGNGFSLTMVGIPAGSFMKRHYCVVCRGQELGMATIDHGFYLGRFPVTQGQFQAVMGYNPSFFPDAGTDAPVEGVIDTDIQQFLAVLNGRQSTFTFRLPSNAEFEYACRAKDESGQYGPSREIGWFKDNSEGTTHPVGQKLPNEWGLYDMLGNVSEWCDYPYAMGCSWNDPEYHLKPYTMIVSVESRRANCFGFRVAADLRN